MGWKDKGRPLGYESIHSLYFIRGCWRGYKRKRGRWLRRMKTTAEIRHYDSEFCRAKRSPSRLPDYYEEFVIRHQRSWKKFRKHRYKES